MCLDMEGHIFLAWKLSIGKKKKTKQGKSTNKPTNYSFTLVCCCFKINSLCSWSSLLQLSFIFLTTVHFVVFKICISDTVHINKIVWDKAVLNMRQVFTRAKTLASMGKI